MIKMYWDELPSGMRGSKKYVDWNNCIGKNCNFEYNEIKGTVEIISYISKGQKIGIKYLNKDIFYMHTSSFLECNIGKYIGAVKSHHIYDIGEVVNGLKITKYIGGNGKEKRYECKCVKCGFNSDKQYYKGGVLRIDRWSVKESHLKSGSECPCCSNIPKIVVTDINSIYKTDSWMIASGVNQELAKKYTSRSGFKIECQCKDCGKILYKKISDIHRAGAVACSCGDGISYPEKFVESVLIQCNLNYITQLTKVDYKWCSDYKYDFFIKNNTIIETHGIQHYQNTTRKKTRSLSDEILNDKIKQELALANGIEEYIAIDCRYSNLEFIKNNILNSRLAELHDLSNIDWNKAGEYAMSNLSKKACDLWNEGGEDISVIKIGEIMHLNSRTIRNWLNKWAKIGLCTYNSTEESRKTIIKNKILSSKKIEVFKDNVSLEIFLSIGDLERRSLDVLGTRCHHSIVTKCCRNDHHGGNEHNGFVFKYAQ